RAGAAGGASSNGDVNGDGSIDIADAVYTLLHLFKGGPAPVACADTPELTARVDALETGAADLRAEVANLAATRSRTVFWLRNFMVGYRFSCSAAQANQEVIAPVFFADVGGLPDTMIRNASLQD